MDRNYRIEAVRGRARAKLRYVKSGEEICPDRNCLAHAGPQGKEAKRYSASGLESGQRGGSRALHLPPGLRLPWAARRAPGRECAGARMAAVQDDSIPAALNLVIHLRWCLLPTHCCFLEWSITIPSKAAMFALARALVAFAMCRALRSFFRPS